MKTHFSYVSKLFMNCLLTTLTALSIVVIFSDYICWPLINLDDKITTILTTIGAAIATILAISFSLSIIPIQKASEDWTPEILEAYKEDCFIHFPIVILSLFILVLFFITTLQLQNSYFKLIIIAILFLAITLDYLRWYYKYVCTLMNPNHAINLAKRKAFELINQNNKDNYKTQNEEIKRWVNSIVDIACRAVHIKSTSIINSTIDSLTLLTKKYLDTANYISPHDVIINHIYEGLSRIKYEAIQSHDEPTLLDLANSLLKISEKFTENHNQNINTQLLYITMDRFVNLIKESQMHNFDNVIIQSANLLKNKISSLIPNELVNDTIYPLLIDFYIDTITYYLHKKSLLTSVLTDNLMKVLQDFIKRQHKNTKEIVSYAFEQFQPLIGYAISYENSSKMPYNLIEPFYASLYSLLNEAKKIGPTVFLETENNMIEPYSSLLEVSESISDQLQKQSVIDFTNSVLLALIKLNIQQIKKLFNDLLNKKIQGFNQEMAVEEISKYLQFLDETSKPTGKKLK